LIGSAKSGHPTKPKARNLTWAGQSSCRADVAALPTMQ